MTSKERLQATFAHTQPDKVAVDFGGMSCSMINAVVLKELRDYYGLEKRLPKINDMSIHDSICRARPAGMHGCGRTAALQLR